MTVKLLEAVPYKRAHVSILIIYILNLKCIRSPLEERP